MKKITTLIALSAIIISQSFGQAGLMTPLNYSSFTAQKAKITKELESSTSKEFKTHPEYGVLPYNAPCKDCYEVLQNRDEKHRYFEKDGTNGKEFYQETAFNDLNYWDNNVLRTIDYRLQPTAAAGVFSAAQQPFPVTVNLRDKYVSIINLGRELKVNRNLSISIKKADGSVVSMGEPSWTDYTAGNDGIMVHNLYPGIDLEIRLGTGKVETFYHVNRPLNLVGEALIIHDNIQLPSDLNYDFSYCDKKENGLYDGSVFVNDVNNAHYYIIGSPAAYDENGASSDRVVRLNFGLDRNKFDLYVPLSWMNSSSRSYPVLIDPVVTATSSLPVASITGSGYNATCFTGGCTYDLGVIVPAATTVTNITTTFWFRAYGSCTLDSGAWDLHLASCRYPTTGYNTCTIGLPGLCQLSNLSCYSAVKPCLPAPRCPVDTLPFVLTFYRCTTIGQGCVFSCINVDPNTPWSMTVTGYRGNAYSSSVSVCQGSNVQLTASSDSGVGTPTYKWYPGSISGNPVSVSPSITTTYTVTASWCQGLDTAQAYALVSVFPNDNPGFTISPNPDCSGAPVTISGQGSRPLTSYDWTVQGGSPPTVSNTKSFTATFASEGTYSITLIDSSGECVFDSTLSVTIANITASAGPDTAVCSGSSVILHASGGATFKWSTGESTSSIVVNPSQTSTYTVTAYTSSGTCSATATAKVTINPNPTVIVTPNGSVSFCQGDSVVLVASGASTYKWNDLETTVSIIVKGNGSFNTVGTDANGCSGTSNTIVTNVKPKGTVTINPVSPLCLTSPAVTLSGSPTGGTFSGQGVVGNTFDPSLTGIGTFTIYYTYSDTGFCLSGAVDSTQVTVSPQATVTISISPTIGCLNHTIYYGYGPQDVTLTANSTSNIIAYQWYDNGVAVAGGTNKTLVVNMSGSYNVQVTVAGGCPSDTNNTAPMLVNVVDIRCGEHLQKILLCHVPPGDTANVQQLCIAPSAVPAHLNNHIYDCLGWCRTHPHIHSHNHLFARSEGDYDLESNDEDMILNVYPNPFSTISTIEFERTSDNAHMLVEVYSLTGEKIATLFDMDAEAGVTYKAELDGTNLAAGVYIYRITSGDKVTNGKWILIK